MKKRRIAILMHQSDSESTAWRYLIHHFADIWRNDGHDVFYLFGIKKFVPADLIFVHVDLSVVPQSYITFAKRYPVSVNANVVDIRKRNFSKNLLKPGDTWEGKVIVKSNKNAAGVPERWRGGLPRKIINKLLSIVNVEHHQLQFLRPSLKSPASYPIYNHLNEVPKHYFYLPGLVVQKFTPEIENNYYCLRYMSFLGDRVSCSKLKSKHPIVTGGTTEIVEHSIEPDPEIMAMRKNLGFDYGKFDYVVVNGKAILLDTNKTVGASANLLDNVEMQKRRNNRAQGLYSFFDA